MKRFLFVLLALCLLYPCAALAADGDLPDIEAFSNGLVEIDADKTAENDYKIKKMYRGTDADVLAVAEAYAELLMEEYGMDEVCRFPIVEEDTDTARIYWAFKYTKSKPSMNVNNIWNDGEGWKIMGYQVLIEYSQSDYYSGEYVQIYYRPEFNYTDTGDRIEASAKSTTKTTNKTTGKECSECKGTGKCQKCGGDMWYWGWEWEYVNGLPESVNVNKLCDAVYCYGGICDKCDGTGRVSN